jgi:diaminohydroxyphosphoribosylaminopyrimidine deaminase/5-amino-6-(5-phosphoribosylamino)uracil reductase
VRVDDPQLTVRPPHHRLRPYTRIVACETDTILKDHRVFAPLEDYAKTIVLAPAGARERFANLADVADIVFVGSGSDLQLDLAGAMKALCERGVQSVLCEGGPTLGARLLAADVVDRVYWAIAPVLLSSDDAVPVLAGTDVAALRRRLNFDLVERVGEDIVISGTFAHHVKT